MYLLFFRASLVRTKKVELKVTGPFDSLITRKCINCSLDKCLIYEPRDTPLAINYVNWSTPIWQRDNLDGFGRLFILTLLGPHFVFV